MVAAVAGAPHVTNRGRLLLAMQVLEAAAIIGLIRRTQSLTGRVGVVAGVLGLFRRDRVLAVGGYDPRMATEDIDLTWRLLLAGWETVYEPHALVGMQVPSTLRALWAQRKRWARGQGEVLHVHFGEVHPLAQPSHVAARASKSLASLVWIVALAASLVIAALGIAIGGEDLFGFAIAWGIAIAVVATVQLIVALTLEHGYDPTILRALPPRGRVSARVLDRRRRGGAALADHRARARPPGAARRLGHPARTARTPRLRPRTTRAPAIADDTLEPRQRVDRGAAQAQLEVQVRAGRVAGRADAADPRAGDHALPRGGRRSATGARTSSSCRAGGRTTTRLP